MRQMIFVCMLLAASSSQSAPRTCRVLSYDGQSVTVEFATGHPLITYLENEGEKRLARVSLPGFPRYEEEGQPVLPARRYHFEVPSAEGVRLEIVELSVSPVDGILPEVLLPGSQTLRQQKDALLDPSLETRKEFVTLSCIGTFRSRFIACVDLFPIIFDREQGRLLHAQRIVVTLRFPPVSLSDVPGGERGLHRSIIVNGEQASRWAKDRDRTRLLQRIPYEFARSDNWVKIRVGENGIYAVTYNDLLNAGVPLGAEAVDPATFRLFSSKPLSQPEPVDSGGSFEDDYHLAEHAILRIGGQSGEFLPGDSLLFYGVGVNGWLNCIDPSSDKRAYYKHIYDTRNVYWLTWEANFTGDPKRIGERNVAPGAAPAPIVVNSYEERLHVEKDLAYDALHTDDRWYWKLLKGTVNPVFMESFYTRDLVDGSRGLIRTIGYGPFSGTYIDEDDRAQVSLNGLELGEMLWRVEKYYAPSKMTIFESEVTAFDPDRNTIEIRTPDDMYIQWYEVFYERKLKSQSGMLDFFAPETVETARFVITGYPSSDVFLFDVTVHGNPVRLSAWRHELGSITFEDELDGSTRHYVAAGRSALKKPALELVSGGAGGLPSLRDESPCPDMLVIYHERFEDAALRLRNHRATRLPHADSPVVRAVDIEDVYNNFSNGMKDAIAIRNYLKFLYDNYRTDGEPVLKYVLLFGNGTYDPRNNFNLGSNYTDFVPLHINIRYLDDKGIEDDDFFAKLDDPTLYSRDFYPDLAIGRMAVATKDEADAWVREIIDYESNIHLGAWRNKVILIADDTSPDRITLDFTFLEDSEFMSGDNGLFPRFIDFEKIYLHHYPLVGDIKPGARNDLGREWSDGALIINYIGHGSNRQLADEWVFLKSDIPSLSNGPRRPLFLAFSCTVGDLEDPFELSMARELIASRRGGAIATICGADPTNYWGNTFLHRALFGSLFTSRDSTGTEPVGTALLLGKLDPLVSGYEKNNSMYHLLGDPAYTLALPAYLVEHETGAIDTMYTGHRYRLSGSVRAGGGIFSSFNGTAEVIVEEAEQRITKEVLWKGTPHTINYRLRGEILYRGEVAVNGGRFSVDFTVPLKCRTGPRARVRSYVRGAATDGVGARDTLLILPTSTKPPNGGPPKITMYFAGQATRVKQGAELIAEISDSEGIAILGVNPQSSIFLEFDRSGFPIFVTDYFTYDYGSSTDGSVQYPLPSGFSPGQHSVIIRAFDNLGESSTDTLAFEVVEEGLHTVSDVFSFPNPVTESTNFVFQVSGGARVHLQLFNTSGVTIWEARMRAEEGFNSIYWDGRDFAGDRPANGTYLYVLEVDFEHSLNRREVVKGKIVVLR